MEHRRLPDAAHLAGAEAHLPTFVPGLQQRRVPADGPDPPEHLRRRAEGARRATSRCGRGRDVFLAGQITGVEGYVESAACGHLVARAIDARLRGARSFRRPPGTALGALYGHVTGAAHPDDYDYQPTNVTWGLFPPLDGRIKKHERRRRWSSGRVR